MFFDFFDWANKNEATCLYSEPFSFSTRYNDDGTQKRVKESEKQKSNRKESVCMLYSIESNNLGTHHFADVNRIKF